VKKLSPSSVPGLVKPMASRVWRGSAKDALLNKLKYIYGVGPRRFNATFEAAAGGAPRIPHSSKKSVTHEQYSSVRVSLDLNPVQCDLHIEEKVRKINV
ncbi:hypothetical protein BHE74_00053854, partial [Ensete ventricosum]